MEKLLSFVIPVYNVEKYLEQCLSSILQQCDDRCEVVMIDDGSKDGSPAICDRFCQMYANARVVHIPNGGNSAARNMGVDLAEGKYICFVDSDDYIDSEAVAKILAWMEHHEADICFLEITKVFADGKMVPMGEGLAGEQLQGKSKEQVLSFMATCPKYPGGPVAKLIRRKFLIKNNIRFPADRRLCEDLFYTLDMYLAAEAFDALDFPYYYYRQNVAGSITSTVTPRYYFDKARFVSYIVEEFCDGKKPKDSIAESTLSFAAYEYSILVWHLVEMHGADGKQALDFLQEYRWVLKYGKSKKTKLVYTVVSLLGLRLAARVMDVYMRNR